MAREKLEIIITAKDKASKVLGRVGKGVGGLAKAAALTGVGAATAGVVGLGAALVKSTELANIQQAAETQLQSVLESTGYAAGFTGDQLKQMASDLQGMTTYGDEAIIGAENLLLTFTNIKGAVYKQALPAILDMSTALGQDLKSSSIMVGKALNDPAVGITALSRAGVSFSEQQKEQVKQWVESGDVMKAQSLILSELEKQFGGSAAAAAGTFAGKVQQMKNEIGDFGEEIGFAVMPVLEPMMDDLMQLAREFLPLVIEKFQTFTSELTERGGPAMEKIGDSLYRIAVATGLAEEGMTGAEQAAAGIGGAFEGIITIIEGVADALERVAAVAEKSESLWDFLTSEELSPGQDPLSRLAFGEGGAPGALGITGHRSIPSMQGEQIYGHQSIPSMQGGAPPINITMPPITVMMDGAKVAELVSQRQSQRLAGLNAVGGPVAL